MAFLIESTCIGKTSVTFHILRNNADNYGLHGFILESTIIKYFIHFSCVA